MITIRTSEDIEYGARIWEQVWPRRSIFDLWDVRARFASCFNNRPYFIVAEESGEIAGFLALSWIEESRSYGQFPGETWQAKTWLEQNKIPARSGQALEALLGSVPGELHLRYISADGLPEGSFPLAVDEVGYLFYPGRYDYRFDTYMKEFSTKSRKKMSREIDGLQSNGVSFRYDHQNDIEWMFRKNLESFGEFSYFKDPRFLASYEQLVAWLSDNKFLRVTTVLLGGEIAAVDIGTVWNRQYTVLAGGTNPEFPGVAKIINLHHLDWACRQRLTVVDFLCGDFGWKNRFHLTHRPLYEIRRNALSMPSVEALHGNDRVIHEH